MVTHPRRVAPTTIELVHRGAGYLRRHDVDAPQATAEQLLTNILNTDRSGLALWREPLTSAQAKAYGRALCRRCTGTPTQLITGEVGFRRLLLSVREGVFIPRPETEILVQETLEALAGVQAPIVIDVGTGSGAIALALKDERPDARVLAVDRSAEAIALARENAERLDLVIELFTGDLLNPVPGSVTGRVDAVVSNPPYVTPDQLARSSAEVRADPLDALLGGPAVHERLARASATVLRRGGILAMEIGDDQADDILDVVGTCGFGGLGVVQDLNGRDRVVLGSRS